jgi:hypothetical protein
MAGNTHMHLVLRLRDSGAIKPLPLYVFRACKGIILTFCVENSCCDVYECSNVSVRACVGKERNQGLIYQGIFIRVVGATAENRTGCLLNASQSPHHQT